MIYFTTIIIMNIILKNYKNIRYIPVDVEIWTELFNKKKANDFR